MSKFSRIVSVTSLGQDELTRMIAPREDVEAISARGLIVEDGEGQRLRGSR